MSNNLKLFSKLLSNEQRHKRSARVTEESEGLVGNRDEVQFLKKDQSRKTWWTLNSKSTQRVRCTSLNRRPQWADTDSTTTTRLCACLILNRYRCGMHTSGQLRLSPQWGQRPDTTFSSRWAKMLPTKLQRSVGALLFCRASQKQTQWCHSIIVAIIANTRASGSATSLDRANRKLAILLQQKKRRISSRLKDFLWSCWRERCFTSQHLWSCCWADSLTVHHHRGVAPFMEQALQHPNLYRLKQCDWCKAACRSPRGLIGGPSVFEGPWTNQCNICNS